MSSPDGSRPLPTEGPTAGGDEFDDLFNYDAGDVNDPFSDNYKPAQQKQTEKDEANKAKSGAGLGIDEEVEVTRKPRAPRVKLDENRLLSANGIPKLRAKAKHHLKFKGKGHEYSDASRLLSFYQLWLDDLFPKARFLDALAMVEKMGHKKRMQIMRMEWINEGKPRSSVHEDSLFDEPELPRREGGEREKTAPRVAPIFETRASERPKTPTRNADVDAEMEDIYDATPRPARTTEVNVSQSAAAVGGSIFGPGKTVIADGPPEDDELGDDELDALLAEEEMLQATSGNVQSAPVTSKASAPQEDFDEDEMEAMAEMDGMW